MSNYYKVGEYIDQSYVKESVRKVYYSRSLFSFAYMAQRRMEANVYNSINAV